MFLCDEDGEGGERDDIPMMHRDECLRSMQAHFEPGDGFEAVLFSGCNTSPADSYPNPLRPKDFVGIKIEPLA